MEPATLETLLLDLVNRRVLKSKRILDAFRNVDRKEFMPSRLKNLAYRNRPFGIGNGQTISQPSVVALMLELLQPQEGEKILDVGSGSGWTTALLSELVGSNGKVIAIERISNLKNFGETNVNKYDFIERKIAQFVLADGKNGFPNEAPFDKILCSAEANKVPLAWKEQLKIGGKIVTPIGHSICLWTKTSKKHFKKTEDYGFQFVPLV